MYKGMSAGAALSMRPADMSIAVMNGPSTGRAYPGPRATGYGPNAREALDERLIEELHARRAAHAGRVSLQRAADNQKAYDDSLKDINKQLAEARRRREFLEEELEKAKTIETSIKRKKARILEGKGKAKHLEQAKAERERKRQAALKRKQEEFGGKPTGVKKVVSPRKTPATTQPKSGGRLIGVLTSGHE